MPLLIGFEPAGLDPKIASAFDDVIAPLQVWANQVDGVNAAERLSIITSGIASLPTVPSGAVFAWPAAAAPTGYLLLNGAAVSRSTYSVLYTLFGTTYGIGDGTTTFNLPNAIQRVILGKATSGTGATLGATGGAIDHTHTGPSHTHTNGTLTVASHTHQAGLWNTSNAGTGATSFENSTVPVENVNLTAGVTVPSQNHTHTGPSHFHTVGPFATGGATSTVDGGATGAAGTGATGTNNPPFLVLQFIIKT